MVTSNVTYLGPAHPPTRRRRALTAAARAALVAVIAGLVASAFAARASAYTPGLGTGSSYCGQAEAGGYNLTVSGKAQQIDGVYACGPLPFKSGGGPAIATFWPISGQAGGFQCTEFAQRYLYTTGGDLASFNDLSGADFVGTVSREFGLPASTPASGQLPHVGDIISEWGDSGTDPTGHVAVVTAVSASSITTLAENETDSGSSPAYSGGHNVITVSAAGWSVNSGYYHYTHFEWLTPHSALPPSGSTWVETSSTDGFGASFGWSSTPFAGTRATLSCDVNGDGKADLVAVNDSSVWVMLSNGSGFDPPQQWSSGAFYGAVKTMCADVNGDGKADLIAQNGNSVWVELSNGISFGPPQQWSLGNFSGTIANLAADVNGDRQADLIAVNYSSGS